MPAYTTKAELIERFGETELIQCTDRGALTGAIVDAVLDRAIADAGEEIDSFLQGRFVLPLASVPRTLSVWAGDLARYRLYEDRGNELVEKRRDDAIAGLKEVRDGKRDLGLTPLGDAAQEVASDAAEIVAGERVFSREKLTGF